MGCEAVTGRYNQECSSRSSYDESGRRSWVGFYTLLLSGRRVAPHRIFQPTEYHVCRLPVEIQMLALKSSQQAPHKIRTSHWSRSAQYGHRKSRGLGRKATRVGNRRWNWDKKLVKVEDEKRRFDAPPQRSA